MTGGRHRAVEQRSEPSSHRRGALVRAHAAWWQAQLAWLVPKTEGNGGHARETETGRHHLQDDQGTGA